ncbi:MAG TPA: SpoIVB peptidase S55 domain-containing protein [Bryobacteraceae bacterium]|nr:SpoIVB peptidase S55 domain-containing protein [Bryobacteraceae bacterium]
MLVRCLTVLLLAVLPLPAALSILPLRDVKAGMHAIGKTVFTGDKVEDFDVEILGVLDNIGPKQSLILGRLSGGPLEHTGVMQGMSGSPVYIDGKLIGAVALAFPYSKDPIAGIRPIEEMLRVESMPARPEPMRLASLTDPASLLRNGLPKPAASASFGDTRMTEVATPISFSGFTSATIEKFAPELRALGLEPRQGISLGGSAIDRMGDPSKLQPGSMISVELMMGDFGVGADGTLTAIDGNKVYAFGHRFLSMGATDLPFTRSEVVTLLANVNTSFKISSARELMGVISQDRDTAVTGTLSTRANMTPLDITVTEEGKPTGEYHMQIVNDRLLSPYLLQMAVFSALDSTARATGVLSVSMHGSIEFQNRSDVAQIRNVYATDGGAATSAALNAATTLSYVMQGGFDDLKLKRISITLDASSRKQALAIGQVYTSKREAKPGDRINITALLDGEDGVEISRTASYTVPPGAAPGTLYFTVCDGGQASLADMRQTIADSPTDATQLISIVNQIRPTDKAYVRVWRAEPSFAVQGAEMASPPPSLALVLGGIPSIAQSKNAKRTELVMDAAGNMVSGSKTVQVEVKE